MGPAREATDAGQRPASGVPRWIDTLCIGLVGYVLACAVLMLTGLGGETVHKYVGLLGESPSSFGALVVLVTATSRMQPGMLRTAWGFLSLALGLYFIGTLFGVASWLEGRDPFPGIPDFFYCAFYPCFVTALMLMIRAAAVRIRWTQFLLDALILVCGFGAFFWFLIIRPASLHNETDMLRNVLSQVYIALNCVLVLLLGVLMLAESGSTAARRSALLLSVGMATMLLADVAWSVAKLTHNYLPGAIQDVLYVACYLPTAFAGREQLRREASTERARSDGGAAHWLSYAAMLMAFAALVMLTHGEEGSPAIIMTYVVFVLALLVLARQALVMREDARSREQRAARMVQDRYESLIANASDVIMIVDADGTLRFASPSAERTLGLSPAEVSGRNLLELWAGGDGERLHAFLREVAASGGETLGPIELSAGQDGARHVLELVGTNLSGDRAVQGLALNFRDITERKGLEDQLRQLAFHDPLTLLANRSLFRDRVQHSLTLAQRGDHHVAVMFLDLDNFKNVNDTLGHDAGDRLLQAVSQRLVKSTRSSDTVARLGGDEFAVLVEGMGTIAEVEALALKLIQEIEQPFSINATAVQVSASIGIAPAAGEASAESVLGMADIAMYQAKSGGKGRAVSFLPTMQELLHERMRLETDISRALAQDEFLLEYQPIIDLGTRSLLGVEALVRWDHPQLGRLPPRRFIQIAEDSGHIIKLGRWVLEHACREVRTWRDTMPGGRGLRVAVNISGRHLQHGDLVGDVAHALRASGLEPGNLVIELTESTIMQNTEVNLSRLLQLKALGVRLAIDDFGTGYSSLSYLHRFPIDILKIDHSFVSRLTSSQNGPELARAVITLGETLGLDTIAEGIELDAEVSALLELGCVAGQGYLFARPGPLAELAQSAFAHCRARLWRPGQDREDLSPSGRYPALEEAGAA